MRLLRILATGILLSFFALSGAQAQQVNLFCQTGTGTGPSSWLPWSTTNPCPVSIGGSSGGTISVKSGSYVSAGTQQNALAVGTNTQLTVPTGSVCAEITVEGASIRRTSDTTSATTTNGTLIQVGAQWQDCGPLAAYKFTAVSGSPTLDVEYFK